MPETQDRQKRRREEASPTRKQLDTSTPQTKRLQSSDDVVLWMPISPQGTLRNALRQRTPSASAISNDTSETHKIVQQIIGNRHTQHTAADSDDKLFADGGIGPVTPVAQRAKNPLLSLSKSERSVDKRVLLSSLLEPGTANTNGGNSSPTLQINGARNRLAEQQAEENEDDLGLDEIDFDELMDGLDGFDDMIQTPAQSESTETAAVDATDAGTNGQQVDGNDSQRFRNYERCLTLLVTEGWYVEGQQQHVQAGTRGARQQKVVRVYSQTAVRERTLLLRSEWAATPIKIGDYVNIVGSLEQAETSNGELVIDSQYSDVLPILHPDILVSCTRLSDAFSCMRRAVLRDRVREIPEGNEPLTVMLLGTLLHDLFQGCAQTNQWDDAAMGELIRKLIETNIERLWECGVDEATVHGQVAEIVPVYQQWAQMYMHARPQPQAQYVEQGRPSDERVAVTRVLNVEENVWSPKFGLQGKIDLTIMAQYAGRAVVEPFELKTGRRTDNPSHRAQLIMYTLLLADRYGVDINAGLLYYPRSGELVRVPRLDVELRALVAQRNAMSGFLAHAPESSQRVLPDMLRNEFMCSRCAFQAPCFVMHRALEEGSARTAGVSIDAWETHTRHLSTLHLAFVRQWMALIDSEEADMLRFRAELWTMQAEYREQQTGRCLAYVHLDVDSVDDSGEIGSYSRFRMTFVARNAASVLNSQLAVGDPVVVSAEPAQYALAVGFVAAINQSGVRVAVDRPVRGVPKRQPGFDHRRCQRFEPLMEIQPRGSGEQTVVHAVVPASAGSDVFRIDKDELSSGMSRIRANVLRLFVGMSARHRRLIVDLDAPTFSALSVQAEARIVEMQRAERLNTGQATALRRVLAADDYALVMGMPGTGKTTAIAALVRVLVHLGKSVLLASYTHAAVDNVLLKLLDSDISMVRLGSRSKVHPRVAGLLPPSASETTSVRELDDFFRNVQVVATTCLGMSHAVFAQRRFDFCIIDEASQITLPVCLGPLLEAQRFVLVGDHRQLPPLVRNSAARDAGLGMSLFKRLCDAHPLSVVRLEFQYRMNADIQRLANSIIYDGHLRCSSLQVADRRIQYKRPLNEAVRLLAHSYHKPSMPTENFAWAIKALDPQHGAVFVDTDAISARECRLEGSESAQNDTEVRLVRSLTSLLQLCGIEGRNVGILSPFRAQLRQLEIAYGIRSASGDIIPADDEPQPSDARTYSGIEMHTIDRYQGRDAEVIIISWVRSNSARAIGELLRDWHRINVAITRARNKLIMVGSRSTLSRSPLLAAMLDILEKDSSIIRVPANGAILADHHTESKDSGSNQNTLTRATAGTALLKTRPITSNLLSD
ncbi:DNA replication endonuclease-helicase Dna2 [Coemansia brasiliensis]|uniref:DNA replication ATP-dependent helicase/nuclease n=1 Tax=Coemansia brasiliensis TaxID=2650707 RepID=A0A9W8I9G1_9FUNG|nr:DNA replication endonuclease-helicase Dna2 [Coemansia brasiliensis]